eukprot:11112077-Lingulodinium_polyedra.AAC.1
MAALPAGATVEVREAGERAEVTATRQAWVRFEVPSTPASGRFKRRHGRVGGGHYRASWAVLGL